MWFKCDSYAPCLDDAVSAVGEKGAFQVMRVVQNAISLNIDISRMDAHTVSRMAGVKIDRARRLLSHVISFFEYTLNYYGQKTIRKVEEIEQKLDRNVDEIYEKSDRNLSDFDTSKPGGSTRVKSKNREEQIRIDNILPLTPSVEGEERESKSFQEFYESYPKKTTKQQALTYWKKNKLSRKASDIMAGLQRWKDSGRWKDVSFAPDPIRFLSHMRWEDFPPVASLGRDGLAGGLYVPDNTEYEPMSGCF